MKLMTATLSAKGQDWSASHPWPMQRDGIRWRTSVCFSFLVLSSVVIHMLEKSTQCAIHNPGFESRECFWCEVNMDPLFDCKLYNALFPWEVSGHERWTFFKTPSMAASNLLIWPPGYWSHYCKVGKLALLFIKKKNISLTTNTHTQAHLSNACAVVLFCYSGIYERTKLSVQFTYRTIDWL